MVEGDSGIGKSSQLASYLADDYILKEPYWSPSPKPIIVTCPRELAALHLQARANMEWFGGIRRGQNADDVKVGYDTGVQLMGEKTLIKYVTE